MLIDLETEKFFETLHKASTNSQLAADLKGRTITAQYAAVVNNEDPENRRRLKVTLDSKGHKVTTDWVIRYLPFPFMDPPMPTVGQRVLVLAIDGDGHNLVYLGVAMNDPNPVLDKLDPIKDYAHEIKGNVTETVGENQDIIIGNNLDTTVGYNYDIKVENNLNTKVGYNYISKADNDITDTALNNIKSTAGKNLTVENSTGVALDLTVAGQMIARATTGYSAFLGTQKIWDMQNNSNTFTLDLAGKSLNIVNAGNVSINGKSIACVDAIDSDGDRIVQRGY